MDTSLPGAVFKTQLYTLTGVPPERQKIMGVKGAPLKARRGLSAAASRARRVLTRARPRRHRTTPT